MGTQSERSDEDIFGDDVNKVRQLLGGCSIALIYHQNFLSDLLDIHTFRVFSENRHILEEICYWFTNPSYFLPENEIYDDIINLLKAFFKRAVNKNANKGIKIIERRGEGLRILFTR